MFRIFALSLGVVGLLGSANAQSLADLYDYQGSPSMPGCWLQASDGNLYQDGYKFNLTTLAAPTAFPLPSCNFIQGTDSNFYAWSGSTITRVTLAGATSSFTLAAANGSSIAALIQGTDGNYYGTANGGGAYGYGTLFSVTPAGAVTTLYSFTNGPDGGNPSSLVQASDGNLYGITFSTIFQSTLAGQVTTIASSLPGDHYSTPGLTEGPDGQLYSLLGPQLYAISLSGALTEQGPSFGQEGPFPPCFLDGEGNFYCSVT